MELNYAFWEVWGVWGGMCNQKGNKWPPIGEKSQITPKSIMKALFCSHTHNKTYFEENMSRGVFHRVFWGCWGSVEEVCVTEKGKKWPPTRKKLQITQKSNMKALYCSHTHTKTYFEENISRRVFHTVFWLVGGVWGGLCNQKRDKWPPIEEKLQITAKSIMKALFCSRSHIKTYFEENISRGIFHRVFCGCRGGVEGVCVTKKAKTDHPQQKNRKSLKNSVWRLYIAPIPTPKHILKRIPPWEYSTQYFGVCGGYV